MPLRSFDMNAYGNPRAQAQRKKAAVTHESARASIANSSSASLHQPPSQTPTPAALNVSRLPSAPLAACPSDIKPSQPAEVELPPQPETAQNYIQHPYVRPPEQQSSGADSCQIKIPAQGQQQLSASTDTDVAENPSTAQPVRENAGEVVNKLDLEPEDTEEGGVDLLRIDPHFITPRMMQTNGKIDAGVQLKQLQDVALKQIARRGKHRAITDEKHSTTSLKDLDLARTAVDPNKPSISHRLWAQGSPVTERKEGEEYIGPKLARDTSSQVPEAPSHQVSPTANQACTTDDANNQPQIFADHSQPHDTKEASSKERNALPKRFKWASNKSMAPEKEEPNSNAWDSANPSDETRGSNVSDKQYGKLLNPKPNIPLETTVTDWDGNFLPAPADWSDRPRFNNNNRHFKAEFSRWLPLSFETGGKPRRFSNGIPYLTISEEELVDLGNHADGIAMVERTATINFHNAAYYGYTDDPNDAIRYSKPTDEDEYLDWGKLDLSDPDNIKHKDERSQDLIDTWLAHLAISRSEYVNVGAKPLKEIPVELTEVASTTMGMSRVRPKLNIYLRPVIKADMSELARVYNWHVANTTRPVETKLIQESDMQQRLKMAQSGKLPFIVAAKKSQKGARAIDDGDGEAELYRQENLPVKHCEQRAVTRVEQLAGFCCAQDLTASDFVEHISAELDIYIDPEYKRMGVGRCLMDKMLEICDRAHIRQTECAFHCDRSIRHHYNPGGGRDLHKLVVLLRKWHTPRAVTIALERGQRVSNNALAKTDENEYERWQKAWFESLGFEVEGTLKRAGAKYGRYLDIVYLARDTSWAPAEGQIPDPFPGFAGNGLNNDDEEDDGY